MPLFKGNLFRGEMKGQRQGQECENSMAVTSKCFETTQLLSLTQGKYVSSKLLQIYNYQEFSKGLVCL